MIPRTDADLLQAHLAEELSADEVRSVNERLMTDDEFARALIVLANEEAILREWARARSASTRFETAAETMPLRPARAVSRTLVRSLFLVAASVLLAMLAAYYSSKPAEPNGRPDGNAKIKKKIVDDDPPPAIGKLD